MPKHKVSVDKVLQALGDPTRRAIVEMLRARPHSVSRLADPLGVTLTAIMQHLQLLQEAGLVRTEKLGRVRTASLHPYGFEALADWIRQCRSPWEQRLDRLGEFLSDSKIDV